MLPRRIEIKNFLAYRTPDPVEFEGIHLACLSGPNGAGKSSLLDAMTWALWGRARAGMDELIHQGQADMLVQLDFEQGPSTYRVVRKRQRSKTGKGSGGTSALDLFIRDEETGGWQSISGTSMRETDEIIRDLLRLDYETFVHSAFLQQGRADAFTAQTPAKRKNILGDILGLARWQAYEDRAKLKIHAIEQELGGIAYEMQRIEQQEAQEPALQRELEQMQAALREADEALAAAEARYAEVAGAEQQMEAARGQQAAAELRVRQIQHELRQTERQLTDLQSTLDNLTAVVAEREAIEAGYARLDEARKTNEALGEKLRVVSGVKDRLGQVNAALRDARAELERQASLHRDRLATAQQSAGSLDDLQADLGDVQAEVLRLDAEDARRAELTEAISDLKADSAALKVENDALLKEMKAIKARLDQIEAAEAVCPLCRQPLDDAHKAALLADITAEGTERGDAHRLNSARQGEIKGEIDASQRAIQEIDAALVRLPALRDRAAALSARLENARTAADSMQAEQSELNVVQALLDSGDYAHELQTQRAQIQAEMDAIGYDGEAHEAAYESLHAYAGYEARQRELEGALQRLPGAQASLAEAQERQTRWQQALADEEQQVIQAREAVEALQSRVDEARARGDEVRQRRAAQRSAQGQVAYAQQRLDALATAREHKGELEARRRTLSEEKSLYEELRVAFGKNGIPAMVIEAAIPELEEDANRLLAQMTEGRMHVRFDTQREKKAGGTIETLDILISDELGTRSYDLYSGGEAFRVDFAIRVALSEMLARRAGAQLRALFIDEGFGTQDDLGRQRLVEAINAVQDHFDLLLVITHIDELRDAFPVQIHVSKTLEGSRVVVR